MNRTPFRILAALALAAIAVVTLSPIGWRPDTVISNDFDRFFAFAVLTLTAVAAFPRRWVWIAVVAIGFAGLLEAMQALQPTRHAQIDDALVKMAGAVIGAIMGRALNEIRVLRARHVGIRRRRAIAAMQYSHDFEDLPVRSRSIAGIHFSPTDGLLHIRFADGEEALFNGVAPGEALALAAAPSPDDYYAENIRKQHSRAA